MKIYNYGGQAVIEGVMMRGRRAAAVAIRREAGDILVHEEQINPHMAGSIWQWPFMRGLALLWDMLILGTRMMMFAANVSIQSIQAAEAAGTAKSDDVTELTATGGAALATGLSAARASGATVQTAPTVKDASAADMEGIGGTGLAFTLLFSIAFAVALFFLVPLGVVRLGHAWLGDGLLSLAAEGVVRLAILIGYLYAIGRMPSVQRVFEYHGAEHKTINAYEAGNPLDVEHVRAASKVHTRCGTGFLLIVVVLSIFVFALIGHPPLPLLVLSRILLVPVIASIAYELMRLGAANYRYRVVRWLMAPSLALQGLTTREPDASQIECAIVALERVLRRDGISVVVQVA
ncbi:MAG: DUF1385 domain-containing protein [Ktedonobacterales bacterium]